MKRLFLVYGQPGAGKSHLATYLETQHSFCRLSVDEVYVEFVKREFPDMYFPKLSEFIKPHYEMIRNFRPHVTSRLGRDLVAEWHCHLLCRVREMLTATDNHIVVEGYLLEDCKNELAAKLHDRATVFEVCAENRTYTSRWRMGTVEEVASIGRDTA